MLETIAMSEPTHPEVAILNAALELREPERTAYLDKTCAGNAALRQQVEALLRAHEQAKDFLETPPAGIIFKRTNLANVPVAEKAGDKIGRYKLLEQIGEGGCGVVYVAEQQEPVRRRVALKIIKLGMDTKSVIARFEAERQALALMDHPNIAKVFDAGATETGRPYFVMELVRGVKITDYCDQNHLSARERLDLFIQVCRAIQHAHQKGIIHRDLKPSNILVTVNDGVPVPKVIDFGIAKATQGRLTDQTVYTAFEQFIGTPAYMSPEQAAMTSLDIDTRSDIYSLGVLLYELLTGKTPFDQKELLAAGLDEMRRTIRETEPPKPSTRLTQELNAKAESGKQKAEIKSAIGNRQSAIPSDLDWIVMKCLEKDRTRRYETANGLASDIQRHLNCEPVVARPPSKFYEFQKTVSRHKFGFGAAALLIIVLAAGVLVSSWEAVRARSAEREQSRLRRLAQTNEKKALTEAAKSRQQAQLVRSILDGLIDSIMVNLSADTNMLEWVLLKTARSRNALIHEPGFEHDDNAQFLLGLMYQRGAGVPKNDDEARSWFLKSAEQHNFWAEDQLGTMYKNGQGVTKDAAAALKWFIKAAEDGHHGDQYRLVRIYKTGDGVPKDDAEALKWERKLAEGGDHNSLVLLANELRAEGNQTEADELFGPLIEKARKEISAKSGDPARLHLELGDLLTSDRKWGEALAIYDEAIRLNPDSDEAWDGRGNCCLCMNDFTNMAKDYSEAIKLKPYVQWYWQERAYAYQSLGQYKKAISDHTKSIELNEQDAGQRVRRGQAYEALGEFSEAEADYSRAIEINPSYWGNWFARARLYSLQNQPDKARADLAESIKQSSSGTVDDQNDLAWALATSTNSTLRDEPAAINLAQKAVAATGRVNASFVDTLAAAYAETGDFEKAVSTEKESIALFTDKKAIDDFTTRLKLYETNTPYREGN